MPAWVQEGVAALAAGKAAQHSEYAGAVKERAVLRALGVRWIARNDDCEEGSAAVVACTTSVLLLADLLGAVPELLAAEIVAERIAAGLVK